MSIKEQIIHDRKWGKELRRRRRLRKGRHNYHRKIEKETPIKLVTKQFAQPVSWWRKLLNRICRK